MAVHTEKVFEVTAPALTDGGDRPKLRYVAKQVVQLVAENGLFIGSFDSFESIEEFLKHFGRNEVVEIVEDGG